ncbi:hypothetical protein KL86DES1_10743 [uncultured Desulfovibrio sp.]|uniref:Uncharacterized protein n=1 Tax=uncultured Desulfovibrio sp. TaxID=167968 RepID=A0A212L0P0_9BACT|nr:hypothetical protein KL86DES1_10743 [uncultured Desulfovibrio sp.]VZH32617.1 conserved protein of unknown function [Desulfovibrio sp. 86]
MLVERSGEVSDMQLSRGALSCQNDIAHNVLRMLRAWALGVQLPYVNFFCNMERACCISMQPLRNVCTWSRA